MKFCIEVGRSRRPVLNDQAVRAHLEDLLTRDKDMRALIARCARSAAKDYLADRAEAELDSPLTPEERAAAYEYLARTERVNYHLADVPADHHEQSRLDLSECDEEAEQALADQGDQFTHIPKGTQR